jgi:hypothetical protein
MMAIEAIRLPYKPRPLQRHEHRMRRGVRFTVLVCHRRFGKTTFSIPELLRSLILSQHHKPQVAYVAPFLNQAKRIAWDDVTHFTQCIPGARPRQSDLIVEFPGRRRLELHGCDYPDRMRGEGFDDVCLDETALCTGTAWTQVIRPMLSDRAGRALFIGSAYGGLNLFKEVWDQAGELGELVGVNGLQEWRRVMYRAPETQLIPADELASLKRTMNAEEFAQEYLCSWAGALPGAFYAEQMLEADTQGRIRALALERDVGCFTAWDLGHSDAMACWVGQECGREVHWLHYEEWIGKGMDFCLHEIAKRAVACGWTFTDHYGPHDMGSHEIFTGTTRKRAAKSLGFEFTVVERHSPAEGIDAVRRLFPRMYFDARGCGTSDKPKPNGLDVLRSYRGEYDPVRRRLANVPVHDWASHGADAIRCYVMGRRQAGRSDWQAPLQIARG